MIYTVALRVVFDSIADPEETLLEIRTAIREASDGVVIVDEARNATPDEQKEYDDA